MEHWLRSHRSAPGKDPAGVDAAERRLALVRGQEAERGPEVGDRLRPGSRCEGHAPPQRTAVLAVGERAPLQNVSDCLARGACMSVAVYTVAVAAAVAAAVAVAVAVAVAAAAAVTVAVAPAIVIPSGSGQRDRAFSAGWSDLSA